MKVLKRIGTIVISVLLWVVILVAALYAFTTMASRDNQNVANLFGYTPLTVQSDSMAPTFSAGDLIFIHTCDPSTLKEGDIICFHTIIDNEYALNTHRIQSIETVGDARSYTTIGDNNNGIADLHVISDGDIVGKYVGHVTGLGKVMDFLSSSMGFLVVIVLPMLLFFVYQIYHLIMISISLSVQWRLKLPRKRKRSAWQQEKLTRRIRSRHRRLRARRRQPLRRPDVCVRKLRRFVRRHRRSLRRRRRMTRMGGYKDCE